MLPLRRNLVLSLFLLQTLCCMSLQCPAQGQESNDPQTAGLGVVQVHNRTLAHAHNDYLHKRPLIDAIENGFSSVEVDIFLEGTELLVGHDRGQLREGRTIEVLYLDPLRRIVKSNSGYVVHPKETFTLLVDIKSNGEKTYSRLHDVLSEYQAMLTETKNGKTEVRPIEVIISGARPIKLIASQKIRWASVDGRISDLDSSAPPHLMPLISDRWSRHFSWQGRGEFPADQRKQLVDWVEKAHGQGRRVRFWATPENEAVWQALSDAKVDLINTDQLEELSAFLKLRNSQ
ncbi:MAG TPA: hypothetical protein DDW52_11470 [Planctomycetaceae bacterium]|nr:hypothetical protein [Planctomycetaceae bacterium]